MVLAATRAMIAAETPGPVANDQVVSLPPLIVESREAPLPWRYLEAPGMEVLSVCDDPATETFVRRCLQLEHALRVILPEKYQAHSSVPDTLILFNDNLSRARSQEVMNAMLQREGGGATVSGPLNLSVLPGVRSTAPRVMFLPNLRLWDEDATAVFAAIREQQAERLEFTFLTDRIASLVELRTPALPDWFVEGMIGFYARTNLAPDTIGVDSAVWTTEAETRALAEDPDRPRTLLSMPAMFAGRRAKAGSETGNDRLWAAQCALFVRWAMVDNEGEHRAALWTLVDRLEKEAMSEGLFREGFGFGYSDLRDRLSDYLPAAVKTTAKISVPKMPGLPELKSRAPTEVEIARIRGDWERMEISLVKKRYPAVVEKYVEQAKRTLMTPYDHGARDPLLLAIIGLTAIDAGDAAGARAYLEAAARGKAVRPRAYVELARLRYEEAMSRSGQDELDAVQTGRILEPLFEADGMQPRLPEVYGTMAEVWRRSVATPTSEQLARFTAGVRFFPAFSPLVLRAIYLNASNGQLEAAAELASAGLLHAPDAATRRSFEKVLDEMNRRGMSH